MYPLRVNGEAFFSTVCELAKLQQYSLVQAKRGCGDSEEEARAQLEGTMALSKRHTRLRSAVADAQLLNVALWDAQKYAESLLDGETLPTKAERRNCLRFIARCRDFRHTHFGLNSFEAFVARAQSRDVMDVFKHYSAGGGNAAKRSPPNRTTAELPSMKGRIT